MNFLLSKKTHKPRQHCRIQLLTQSRVNGVYPMLRKSHIHVKQVLEGHHDRCQYHKQQEDDADLPLPWLTSPLESQQCYLVITLQCGLARHRLLASRSRLCCQLIWGLQHISLPYCFRLPSGKARKDSLNSELLLYAKTTVLCTQSNP